MSTTRDRMNKLDLFGSFPAGVATPLTIDDLPDNERELYWTHHYKHDSRTRRNPNVNSDVVDTILTHGVVKKSKDYVDRYMVQAAFDGVQWVLVIGDRGIESDPRWAAVTIYSNYHGSTGATNAYRDRKRSTTETDTSKYGHLTN